VLCRHCHRQLEREASVCRVCGRSVAGRAPSLELVALDGSRTELSRALTIGRDAENDLALDDVSVSRRHARIEIVAGRALIEDVGSSHGTFLDGRRISAPEELRAGSRIQLGDRAMFVREVEREGAAGATLVVPTGASGAMPAIEAPATMTAEHSLRPRVRSGWALKRMAGEDGEQHVLRDLRGGRFARLGDEEEALFRLLDGERTLPELVGLSEERFGAAGPAALARLLTHLAERGMLHGGPSADEAVPDIPVGRLRSLLRPRSWSSPAFAGFVERAYDRGAWVLFLKPVLAVLAVLSVAGLASFGYLVAYRYGTPFVVARHVGLGAAVFVVGRLALVALHELAHGLACASYGRRAARAGIKLVLIFPYAFVDTSEAWFEPRKRRISISAAGPISDLALGGAFAVASLLSGHGALRDVEFQVALGAYLGALFNLSPMLDRDGYHILIDVVRQPSLRERARAWLGSRLSGERQREDARALVVFASATIVWSLVSALFALVMSLRYYDVMLRLAPRELVWGLLGSFFMVLLIPLFTMVGTPLMRRRARLVDDDA
jgi:RNA polymerase subunit RPABC4/transcription elongation factor Spt4